MSIVVLAVMVGGVGMLSTVLAQWKVNNQIYGSSSPSIKYGPQINGSVYTPAATSRAMPSEVRHAYWKSGDLPSTVRMNAAAIGPLAPSGPMAYVTPQPVKERVVTTGNYVNTSIGPRGSGGRVTPSHGSVRYAGLPNHQFAGGATVKTPVAVAGSANAGAAVAMVGGNEGIDWASVMPTGGSIRHASTDLVMPKYLPPAPADPFLRQPAASTAPAPRG